MSLNQANDHKHGRLLYRYHPRSDFHSRKLCELVLADLLSACPKLAEHARAGLVVGGVNAKYTFGNGKKKALDLAIGTPTGSPVPPTPPAPILMADIGELRISIEAKQCMTEHSKSKPRIFDELSSSHAIVHKGVPNAIACGIVVVNVASKYASPTRQVAKGPVVYTPHRQPAAAQGIIDILRGLHRRADVSEVGFDAFATIVIDCDNLGPCKLYEDPPAPQKGDRDFYNGFIDDISCAYAARFP